ncbi:MAG: FHA domain-containing protein [Polyangiaceae bacterium]|nr:FHA domain-containing protein [Polyangiaceae bacterium]
MRDDMHTGFTGWGCGNDGTLVATSEPLEALLPLSPKAAFVAAYTRMAELGRHLPARRFVAVVVAKEPFAALVLETAAARTRYTASASRLERDILLGRYDRCDVLLAAQENQVSRVHALIVRLGDETWVVDTASTNGTRRRGERVRACVLEDADRIALSNELEVGWRRLG